MRRLAVLAAVAAAGAALATTADRRPTAPRRIEPVPHAASAEQQARNLAAWLRRYSR